MRVFRAEDATGQPWPRLFSREWPGRRPLRFRSWPVLALGLILVSGLIGSPPPALQGDGLLTLLGGGTIAALIAIELFVDPQTLRAAGLFSFALGVGSILLMLVQDGGTAVLGTYAAVAGAVIRLPRRRALLVIVPIIAAVNALILADGSDRLLVLAWTNIAYAFMFVIGHLVRLGEERQAQAQALLDEEERTRLARTEAAALDERGRIARELHDVLAHSLSALSVELEGARLLAEDRHADPSVVEAIERAHRHATTGLDEARAAIEALRGDAVPGPERIADLVSGFEAEGTASSLEVSGAPRRLSSEAALAVYRTAQEALTNVRKHAHADRVEVRLAYDEDGTCLRVENDGRARDAPPGNGYGVTGMRERAELVGGRLLAGPTDRGYRVELWIPA